MFNKVFFFFFKIILITFGTYLIFMGKENFLECEYLEWEILCGIIYSSMVQNANHVDDAEWSWCFTLP